MKRMFVLTLTLVTLFLLAAPIEADFIQCVLNVFCAGTQGIDLINGTPGDDDIDGSGDDDVIFAGDGRDDSVIGNSGNDLIFGGAHSDNIEGSMGNDLIFPGPDDLQTIQIAEGDNDNDTFYIFVGETINCTFILGDQDFDVVNLIGFGPFIGTLPFGQDTIPTDSWIMVEDPTAGGFVFIEVSTADDNSAEVINGLPTLNLAIVNGSIGAVANQYCIVPD